MIEELKEYDLLECSPTGAEDRSISGIKPGAPMTRKTPIDYTGSNFAHPLL